MVETLGAGYERVKPASTEASLEQARTISLASVLHQAGETTRAYEAGMDRELTPEENTRVWFSRISNMGDGMYPHSEDSATNKSINLRGKENDLYIALTPDGKGVYSTDATADIDNTHKRVRIDAVVVRKGNLVSVRTEDGSNITVPMSVLQESFLLTHADSLVTDTMSPAQKEILGAYVKTKKGILPYTPSNFEPRAMKEAAGETPAIKAESARKYAKKMMDEAATATDITGMEDRIKELQTLHDRLAGQEICTAEDMRELIRITTSEQFTRMSVTQIETDWNASDLEIKRLKMQIETTTDPTQRAQLEVLLQKQQTRQNELSMLKDLHVTMGDQKSMDAITGFFEQAQNGGLDSATLGRINTALENGNMDDIAKEALAQLEKNTTMTATQKEEVTKRVNELKEKALLVGGGLLLMLLLMMVQSATQNK